MFPPMLIYVRAGEEAKNPFGMWLPLFLVWLLLLPLVLLVVAATLLVDLVLLLAGQPYHHYTLLFVRALGLLGAARGSSFHIRADKHVVDIDLV